MHNTFKVIFFSNVSSKTDCIFRFISNESSRVISEDVLLCVFADFPVKTVAIIPPFLASLSLCSSYCGGARAPDCSLMMKL